jgi:hypothetical protein
MTDLIVRQVLDDQNHDDLVGGHPGGPGGEGIPEPPVTGLTYGRGGGVWSPVLDLATTQAQQIQGPIITASGTINAPGLMIGSNDTGFWRSGQLLYLSGGVEAQMMAWMPGLTVSWNPINMGGQVINTLGDGVAAQDALNLRTGDRLYGTGPWVNFVPDPGWTSNTIRHRLIDGARSLQVAGDIQAPLPVNARARVGILSEGYRPARNYRLPGVCSLGVNFGWAMWEISMNGEVWTVWSLGNPPEIGAGSINAMIPMD